MTQPIFARPGGWFDSFRHDGPVRLLNLAISELLGQSSRRLGGPRENENATDGSIKSADNPQKDFTWFFIFFADVLFRNINEAGLARLTPIVGIVAGLFSASR